MWRTAEKNSIGRHRRRCEDEKNGSTNYALGLHALDLSGLDY